VAAHKLPFLNGSGFELPPLHVFRWWNSRVLATR
jgi:hypothetical protein